jgi:hypothetical protein
MMWLLGDRVRFQAGVEAMIGANGLEDILPIAIGSYQGRGA